MKCMYVQRIGAFPVALVAALCVTFAGCSGVPQSNLTATNGSIVSATRTTSATENVLYSFGAGTNDGYAPVAALTYVAGTLYGTTSLGGGGKHYSGTIFSITPSGTYRQLYRFFYDDPGGLNPDGGLTNVAGTLYGTTFNGSRCGCYGTVFKMTASKKTTLYHFHGTPDGASPDADLKNVAGTLYGTTFYGGANGAGTVFTITQSGSESVLHSFGSAGDGIGPRAALTNVRGKLYGTTYAGGEQCVSGGGCGTVFSITTAGTYRQLYNFAGGADGKWPFGTLTDLGGVLYGTTEYGGANDLGTVFKITTAGVETVLYSFKGGSDAAQPLGQLINISGTLYGTSAGGGNGVGTVFKITQGGLETVIYRFGGQPDGANPYDALTEVNGILYGTTVNGGANNRGTVFSLSGF